MKLLKWLIHRVKSLRKTIDSVHFEHFNCFIKQDQIGPKMTNNHHMSHVYKKTDLFGDCDTRGARLYSQKVLESQFLSSGKQKLWPKIFHCQWHDRMSDHYFLARLKRFRTLSLNNLLHMIEFLMIRSCSTN